MKRGVILFLLVMVAINAISFYLEPEQKTIGNAIMYGALIVGVTLLFYRWVLKSNLTE